MAMQKGLANALGRNHCFLNVIIQSLWHTKSFHAAFLAHCSSHEACPSTTPCLVCALRDVFSDFESTEAHPVSPDALRRVLETVDEQFQVGRMNDAAETFDVMIDVLHQAAIGKAVEGRTTDAQNSFVRQVFGLQFTQSLICSKCGTTSKDLLYSTNLYYIPAAPLAENKDDKSFGSLLRQVCQTDCKSCDSPGCRSTPQPVVTEAHVLPHVLVLGVVWPCSRVSHESLIGFLANLRLQFQVSDLFDGPASNATATLMGLVLYYASHYIAVLWLPGAAEWVLFDDRRVRPLGPHWLPVLQHMIMGHLQPLLLFYSLAADGPLPKDYEPPADTDEVKATRLEALHHALEQVKSGNKRSVALLDDISDADDDQLARLVEIFGDTYSTDQLQALLAAHQGDLQQVMDTLMEGREGINTEATGNDASVTAISQSSSTVSPFITSSTTAHMAPSPIFEMKKALYRTASQTFAEVSLVGHHSPPPPIFNGLHFLLLGTPAHKGESKGELTRVIQESGGQVTKFWSSKKPKKVTHIIVMCNTSDPTQVAKDTQCQFVLKPSFVNVSLQRRCKEPETLHMWRPQKFLSLPLRDMPAPTLKVNNVKSLLMADRSKTTSPDVRRRHTVGPRVLKAENGVSRHEGTGADENIIISDGEAEDHAQHPRSRDVDVTNKSAQPHSSPMQPQFISPSRPLTNAQGLRQFKRRRQSCLEFPGPS